jgi:recombination DNA repair RAD52 pathway protein
MAPDLLPVPDPSRLTTEQLDRALVALEKLISARLDGMDTALDLATERMNRQPSEIDKAIDHLKELHNGSISSLKELHNAAIHDTQKSAEMLTNVLQTAVIKSEASYTKQFDAINLNNQTQNKANADRIEDIKERLDRSEGSTVGKTDTEKSHRDMTSLWIALAACIAAFLAAAIAAVGLFIAVYHKV